MSKASYEDHLVALGTLISRRGEDVSEKEAAHRRRIVALGQEAENLSGSMAGWMRRRKAMRAILAYIRRYSD